MVDDFGFSRTPINLKIENRLNIRESVYEYLRNEILKGVFPPSVRMVETQLAKRIGTSRTPVREALHLLEKEGLLESIPRVGYRVKEVKWEEVEEICEIRRVNETLAAQWAIKNMTQKDLQALEENLVVSDEAVKEGHPESVVEHDAEFHEILVRASGSQRLLELCNMLRRHMLRYRIESLYLPDVALRAIAGHRRIVDCLRERDEENVKLAIRDHLQQSKADMLRYTFEERV